MVELDINAGGVALAIIADVECTLGARLVEDEGLAVCKTIRILPYGLSLDDVILGHCVRSILEYDSTTLRGVAISIKFIVFVYQIVTSLSFYLSFMKF